MVLVNRAERITVDAAVLVGKPIIIGTRSSSWISWGVVGPSSTRADIQACLAYAGGVLKSAWSTCFPSSEERRDAIRVERERPLIGSPVLACRGGMVCCPSRRRCAAVTTEQSLRGRKLNVGS